MAVAPASKRRFMIASKGGTRPGGNAMGGPGFRPQPDDDAERRPVIEAASLRLSNAGCSRSASWAFKSQYCASFIQRDLSSSRDALRAMRKQFSAVSRSIDVMTFPLNQKL